MASFCSFFSIFMVFITCFSTLVLTAQEHVHLSTIPALLPEAPMSSSSPPTLSPDILPLFPTPKAGAPSPGDPFVPIIPSSPSPPNPDVVMPAQGPASAMAMAPDGSLPVSSSPALASSGDLTLEVFIGLSVFCLFELSFP